MNGDKAKKAQRRFDPDGGGYDWDAAHSAGLEPDETGHMPSLVPETGLVLKGIKHPTFYKTLEAEKKLGNVIIRIAKDRYYSIPKTELPKFKGVEVLK